MRVAVIGAGSWGTALALVLAEAGHEVVLWARTPEVARAINEEHRNPRYLSDYRLPSAIRATADYACACEGAEAVVIVTPSAALRSVAADLRELIAPGTPIVICSKGVEEKTGLLPIDTFAAELGNAGRMAVLSGPTHAEEVICRKPSAAVVASADEGTALFFRDLFATRFFRTYTSDDPVGVELCAAFKNVIAIAVGISYGMGFGDNTAAMLITRGLAEMSRMVVAAGGEARGRRRHGGHLHVAALAQPAVRRAVRGPRPYPGRFHGADPHGGGRGHRLQDPGHARGPLRGRFASD